MEASPRKVHYMDRHDTSMTEGPIIQHLIWFALPVMVGYIFQQFYNAVDSIIVGRFVSMQALAAVGSTGNIINTLIGAFMGLATGTGVIIAQNYGAREDERVSQAVHTSMVLALLFGATLTIIGYFFAPAMLRFMCTPDDVFPDALLYLRIYFAGSAALLVYNLGAGILRAVGDSRRPVYFLVASAAVNVVLDLVFVAGFQMGIAGVGWATVIAELVSAAWVVVTLMRTEESYQLRLSQLKIHGAMLKKILRIGLPSSFQQMLVNFSNVFVQSYINSFQTACMAGWSSFGKIDGFSTIPLSAFSMAVTTFVGQNIGAGRLDRAKKGVNAALLLCTVSVIIIVIPLEIFAPSLIGLFGAEGEALDYGIMFLRWLAPLGIMLLGSSVHGGALRGAGDTIWPTIIQMLGFIAVRQVYLAVIARLTDSSLLVGMSYPVGRFACSAGLILYYYCSGWERRMLHLTEKSGQAHMG